MAVLFPLKCHRWVWGTRRMEQVAILLKHKFPTLGDQLLGIIELAYSEKDRGSSTRLAQSAIQQVDTAVRERNFSDAVPHARHRFWATVVAVPVLDPVPTRRVDVHWRASMGESPAVDAVRPALREASRSI